MGDMFWRGRNFKVVQIDAAKNITGVRWGGLYFDIYGGIVMKSCSTYAKIGANRLLFTQAGDPFQTVRMDQRRE